MIIVAIRDRALDAYMNPFPMQSIGQAIRAFADEVNKADPNNPLYAHPEDYDLYYLADFNANTGDFTKTHRMIAVGKDCRIAPKGNGSIPVDRTINNQLHHHEGA